ncbi:hypothetical protein [Stieleria neptunia]|uniref:hypothetical protein n=1 Tax=Stieleria neptunia TaxID=2527979 RepID=UPI0011A0B5DC|nr:hypothetical protein [Stieleria neptunia]
MAPFIRCYFLSRWQKNRGQKNGWAVGRKTRKWVTRKYGVERSGRREAEWRLRVTDSADWKLLRAIHLLVTHFLAVPSSGDSIFLPAIFLPSQSVALAIGWHHSSCHCVSCRVFGRQVVATAANRDRIN